MASQLDLHAYIFLGNALNYLVNAVEQDGAMAEALGVVTDRGAAQLRALFAAVEPLKPGNFFEGLAALPEDERQLLLRAARWCVDSLGEEFETRMGIYPAEAEEVIAALAPRT